jgi:molybdenum cofactor cytidylyltransferase
MEFGTFNLIECEGALLAHGLTLPSGRLRKGHKLSDQDIAACQQAGLASLIVARLAPDDVAEDDAAQNIAAGLHAASVRAGESRTGRVNLYARTNGLLTYGPEQLLHFNRIDEGLTLALLPPFTPVRSGQMIGTVKIIPFALPRHIVQHGVVKCHMIGLNVHPYKPLSIALVQTLLPETKSSIIAKTAATTHNRVCALDANFIDAGQVPHDTQSLTLRLRAIDADIILIIGASAIADRGDIIPASISAAGGSIVRVGMPVDPGNLLCLGQLGRAHVIGLPGCARSPKRNGFDLILERLCAGLNVDNHDIAAMGMGGLLEDVAERALPRAVAAAPRIGAILLAAGTSSRMGTQNKLLLPTPAGALVRQTALSLEAAGITSVIAVLGHQAEQTGTALRGAVSQMIYNPDFASGMASSIRAGLAAAPADWDGAFIVLGDMPLILPTSLQALMKQFSPAHGREIIIPHVAGQRANPIIWAREHWPKLMTLQGDIGGRGLLVAAGDAVCAVMLEDDGLLEDVDDPASWQNIKIRLQPEVLKDGVE